MESAANYIILSNVVKMNDAALHTVENVSS